MRKATLVSFLVGLAVGIGAMLLRCEMKFQYFDKSPENFTALLDRRLDLNAEQSTAIKAIVLKTFQEIDTLKTEIRPRFKEIQERSQAEIRQHLDDKQKSKFQKFIEKWEAKKKEMRGGK